MTAPVKIHPTALLKGRQLADNLNAAKDRAFIAWLQRAAARRETATEATA